MGVQGCVLYRGYTVRWNLSSPFLSLNSISSDIKKKQFKDRSGRKSLHHIFTCKNKTGLSGEMKGMTEKENRNTL